VDNRHGKLARRQRASCSAWISSWRIEVPPLGSPFSHFLENKVGVQTGVRSRSSVYWRGGDNVVDRDDSRTRHDHVRLSHALWHVMIHMLSPCPTLPMTGLVETELFGGAIKTNYPENFIDVSYVIDCESKLGSFQPTLT
jgi:hypothetical protein